MDRPEREEDVYPAIPGTYFERTPKDLRKELQKIRTACPYRVRLETDAAWVRVVVESYDGMQVHYLVWDMRQGTVAGITNLLNLITTNTPGYSRMAGGMVLKYIVPYPGTIQIFDYSGTFAVGTFPVCNPLIRALEDAREILSTL